MVLGRCELASQEITPHVDVTASPIDIDRVLTELPSLAFVTVRSLFTDDWQSVVLERLEAPDGVAITGIRVKRTTTSTDSGDVVQVVDVKLENRARPFFRQVAVSQASEYAERRTLVERSMTARRTYAMSPNRPETSDHAAKNIALHDVLANDTRPTVPVVLSTGGAVRLSIICSSR